MSELKDQDPDYGPSITNTEKQQRLFEENARISTARKITAIIEKEFSQEIASKEKEIFEIQNRLQRALKTLHLLRYVIVTDFYNRKQCKLQTDSRQTQPHPAVKSLIGKTPKRYFPTTITSSDGNAVTEKQASDDIECLPGTSAQSYFAETLHKSETICLNQQEDEVTGLKLEERKGVTTNSRLQGECSKVNSSRVSTEENLFSNVVGSDENDLTLSSFQTKAVERKINCSNYAHSSTNSFESLLDKNIKDNSFEGSTNKCAERSLNLDDCKNLNFVNFDTLYSNNSEGSNSSYFDNLIGRTSRSNSLENLKSDVFEKSSSSNKFGSNVVDDSKEGPKKVPRYIPPKSTSPSSSPSRLRQKVRKRLIIGNISKWIPPEYREDNSTHKWTIYVQGNRENRNIDYISKVRFFLHPSYRPNDVIEVSSYPFCISRRGWGEFPIRIQLHFKNSLNKPVDVIHYLKLDKSYTGLQTLGSETVVDVWIYEENDKAKRKAKCMEEDSGKTLEGTETFKKRCTEDHADLVNGNLEHKSLKKELENGEVNFKNENETVKDLQSNKEFCEDFSNTSNNKTYTTPNYAQETEMRLNNYNRQKENSLSNLGSATNDIKYGDQYLYTENFAKPTGLRERKSPQKVLLPDSSNVESENYRANHKINTVKLKEDLFNCASTVSNECIEQKLEISEDLIMENVKEECSANDKHNAEQEVAANLEKEDISDTRDHFVKDINELSTELAPCNFTKSVENKGDSSLERSRAVVLLDHDYLGSKFLGTENEFKTFLETEKATQSTAKDRMTKFSSNLQPLKISIPPLFEPSSKKVLVLQNDKTIPVEIMSKPKNKFAGRSLLKENSNKAAGASNNVASNQETKKDSDTFKTNSKAVIFNVNSSVPTLKIVDAPSRNNVESNSHKTCNDRTVKKEEQWVERESINFDLNEVQLNSCLGISLESQTHSWSTLGQESRRSNDWMYTITSGSRPEEVQSSRPKLTIGKDKHKLQNKRELYEETLRCIKSIELTDTQSFLRFVIARLPLITENATDPEYRKLHPYSCTTEHEYFGFSVAKQRAMEWARAKLAREFLKRTKDAEDLWSVKEILMWARSHGYTPVQQQSTGESSRNHRNCFNTVTEPREFIKWKDSNPTSSMDPDFDSNINVVDVESDERDEQKEEKRLEVLGIEKKLEPLYEFVCTTSREIGLRLQPEEVVPNIAYCAAARMIMKAVECLVDDVLRSSLAKAWERHDYSACPSVIALDDVRQAIQNREEFSLFTNSGLGSIYRPPKD